MPRLPVFALAQFFMSLSWVAYAIFLPSMATQVGLPKSAVVWLLLIDQVVFMIADLLAGAFSDRMESAVLHWGRTLGMLTGISALALLSLPLLAAATASPVALVVPALIWVAGSAALRAPLFALIGKHAQSATGDDFRWLLLGNGVALACAPYLGTVLKGISPLVPFALISAGLVLCGVLVMQSTRDGGLASSPSASATDEAALPQVPVFFLALLIAALGVQVHSAFNAGQFYSRTVPAAELHWWLPMFWVGFNLALVVPPMLGTWPAARRLGAFAAVGMLALAGCTAAAEPLAQAALQAVAGVAWAWFVSGAFATANALGYPAHRGGMAGGVHAALAGGSALRLVMASAALPQALGSNLFLVPVALFALAAFVLWLASRGRAVSRGV